ncbi:hypothetical protein UlMin_016769 [Ulmus minor]
MDPASLAQDHVVGDKDDDDASSEDDGDASSGDEADVSESFEQLKTGREAVNYGLAGSVIGAVSTAGVAWTYSRSLHGPGLSFVASGIFGWTFGQEIAGHALQLYRLDTLTAHTKFLEWLENKCERYS